MAALNISPRSVLITGANRGLGLEFVKQILSLPSPPRYVFATCRNPGAATDLVELQKKHSSINILKIDHDNSQSITEARDKVEAILEGQGLNLLIVNAGFLKNATLADVTAEELMASFKTNTVGPILIAQAFTSLLKKAASEFGKPGMSCDKASIINISTKVASIADNSSGSLYPYRVAKAGLNIANKSMSVDLKASEIMAVLLHPGWVQTDLGGSRASTTIPDSVKGMMDVMAGLTETSTGLFYDFKGEAIPW